MILAVLLKPFPAQHTASYLAWHCVATRFNGILWGYLVGGLHSIPSQPRLDQRIVGKIAGVTRLPASAVGAIDIHEDYSLADVAEPDAALIVQKLTGIPLKEVSLAPVLEKPASGA